MAEYPSVEKLMAGPLGQWLQTKQSIREDAKQRTRIRIWVIAIALPILAALALTFFEFDLKKFLGTGAIVVVASLMWAYNPNYKAANQVKAGINEAIADALGFNYSRELKSSKAYELAKLFRLVPYHKKAQLEDSWSGSLAGRPFNLHEARLMDGQRPGSSNRRFIVFYGVILSIDLNRKLHGTTLVTREGRYRSLFGLNSKQDSIAVGEGQLSYVDMTHPDFEDSFDVYSNDQVEARYIIHPEYIERLIAVEDAFHGSNVVSLFHEGTLVIALASVNLFESGSVDAKDDRSNIQQTIEQFARLADLASNLQESMR